MSSTTTNNTKKVESRISYITMGMPGEQIVPYNEPIGKVMIEIYEKHPTTIITGHDILIDGKVVNPKNH